MGWTIIIPHLKSQSLGPLSLSLSSLSMSFSCFMYNDVYVYIYDTSLLFALFGVQGYTWEMERSPGVGRGCVCVEQVES